MITDWDDAYNNRNYSPNVDKIVEEWSSSAEQFRESMEKAGMAQLGISYGPGKRNLLDKFLPNSSENGMVIFVHGGYWRAFDNSYFSHFAAGALSNELAVYLPSYTLAPEVSIAEITQEIAAAIQFVANDRDGPITLVGHSAGGHLVTRMVCQDTQIDEDVRDRIKSVVSLSGVHDLRPLVNTVMNDDFGLTLALAEAESPALCLPVPGCKITCISGSNERPEFLRQSELLANIWTGLGADISAITIPSRNHFTLINDLVEQNSPITNIVVGH